MAVAFAANGQQLTRDGSYLDPTAPFTIVGWWKQGTTTPTGTTYRDYYQYGNPTVATNPTLYLGSSDADVATLRLTFWDGALYIQTAAYTPALSTWIPYAIRYDGIDQLDFIIDAVVFDSLTKDLATVTFVETDEAIGSDWNDFGVQYVGVFQAALTLAQITAQSQSQVPLTTALSFTPLYWPLDDALSDISGNSHDWTLTGTLTYLLGPDVGLGAAVLLTAADSSLVPGNFMAVTATGALTAQLSTAAINELARRDSDSHVFVFLQNSTVLEFTETLQYVQTFGNTNPTNPASLVPTAPTNLNWTGQLIQFVGSSVFLSWLGGFSTFPHVALQQRDATTFALTTTYTDFNVGLPVGNSSAGALSTNAQLLYFKDVGASVADQNLVYARFLLGSTTSTFALYDVWTPPSTGWRVWNLRRASDGRVIVLYVHVTSGVNDDARFIVYTSAGAVVSTFQPTNLVVGMSIAVTQMFALDADETGLWGTALFGPTAPDFYSVYTHYRLSDGAILETAFPVLSQQEGNSSTNPMLATGGLTPSTTTNEAIRVLRRFPHISEQNLLLFISRLEVELQRGMGLATGQGSDPLVLLRISRDGGQTYFSARWMQAGKMGHYLQRVFTTRLGRSRDWVFELTCSDPTFVSWANVWIDVDLGSS